MKYWIMGIFLLLADGISKYWAQDFFSGEHILQVISVIPEFFTLQIFFNEGVAFSLAIPRFIQIFLTLGFLIFFFIWAKEHFFKLSAWEKWGSVFLVSGAIGNFVERVIDGRVTDFLAFHLPFFGGFDFPVFNFADIWIFLGVCLWLVGAIQEKKEEEISD